MKRMIVWHVVILLVFFLSLVASSSKVVAQTAEKPVLPDLIQGTSMLPWPIDWESYTWNIVPIAEVQDQVPDEIWQVAGACEAEYAQVGADYLNIFCPFIVDDEADFLSQAVIDEVTDGWMYVTSYYSAAYYTGEWAVAIRVGLPPWEGGDTSYPVLGAVERVMASRYPETYFLDQFAQAYSTLLDTPVQASDLQYQAELLAFFLIHGEEWYYYSPTNAGYQKVSAYTGNENCSPAGEGQICRSSEQIDPTKFPTQVVCREGTTPMWDNHQFPVCFVGEPGEAPEGWQTLPRQ